MLAVLVTSSFLAGCATVRQQLGAALVPPRTEMQLGAQMAAQIGQMEKLHPDEGLQRYILEVAEPLARLSLKDRPGITYVLAVLDDDEQVNAFAAPGGYLFVYSGLLLMAENEAELAGVLAHEIGHVVGRHSANQLATRYGMEFLFRLALGTEPDEMAAMTSDWLGTGAAARFSRDDEREADDYGFRYLLSAGYDPEGLLTFFEKIGEFEARPGSDLDALMASHPATDERIERLRQKIAQAGDPGGRLEAERYRQRTSVLRR